MKEKNLYPSISGIHHVTAIAGNAQKNYDFYAKLLGLKLVKKTINFDDPHTYHLYFGNEAGSPGTILTFFPWSEQAYKGRRGSGQVTTISFSISAESVSFWIERLKKFGIQYSEPYKRFDEEVILFEDHDGFELELVSSGNNIINGWNNGEIPEENSIRGFHSVTQTIDGLSATENLLINQLGFSKNNESVNRHRYKTSGNEAGIFLDILNLPNSLSGRMGVGAVHHIAWRTESDETQLLFREKLIDNGFNVTPVTDRNYFNSIYFREPGNVLFEIATDPPGFLIDEDRENLGKHLKLPPWYEKNRTQIENALPELRTE